MEVTFVAFKQFNDVDAMKIARKIKKKIETSPTLTPRSLKHLRTQISAGRAVLGYDNKEIISFLIVYPVSKKVFEIQSLLVESKYRRNGYAKKMVQKVIAQYREDKILANSFEPEVIRFLENFGFSRNAFSQLSILEKLKYISSRSYYSLWKHFLVKKAVLLCYSKSY